MRAPEAWALAAAAIAAAVAAAPQDARAEETIRVSVAGGKVKELPLEAYVAGVVAGEMPADFPPEALKAQAVAARTFALVRKLDAEDAGRKHHLGATVLSQVFSGAEPPPAARAAADGTAGEVIVFGREQAPIEAYFHSSCGGRTESGAAALGRDLPYLASVECGRCDGAPRARWKVDVTGAELGKAAGLGRAATEVKVASRTAAGRADRVELAAGARRAVLSGAELRQRVGYARLPSLWFDVREEKGVFRFEGRGSGHGAGLCQWGAAGMAREGATYREILGRYYPGTDVVKMY